MSLKPYYENNGITIYNGDCFEIIPNITESLDLIVTSPPYNENKEYDKYVDGIKLSEWISNITSFLSVIKDKMKDDGRICLNLSESCRSPFCPKPQIIISKMYESGWVLRGDIIWKKPGYKGTAWGSWKSPSNPTITDNSEHIIVASKNVLKKLGQKENIDISANEFASWVTGHWEISPSRSKEHPCIFPEELSTRCIKLYSFVGDTVCDPFMGIGTTLVSSKKHKRRCIGIEISKKYCDIAIKRLENSNA